MDLSKLKEELEKARKDPEWDEYSHIYECGRKLRNAISDLQHAIWQAEKGSLGYKGTLPNPPALGIVVSDGLSASGEIK